MTRARGAAVSILLRIFPPSRMIASLYRTTLLLAVFTYIGVSPGVSIAAPGDTQVLKWKDGRKAVFMLAFDDGAPTQLQNVVPELQKRRIPGTFYLVTGNSL